MREKGLVDVEDHRGYVVRNWLHPPGQIRGGQREVAGDQESGGRLHAPDRDREERKVHDAPVHQPIAA